MVFPLRKENSINGLIMAILENNDTSLRYTVLEESQKGYTEILQRFLAVDKENDRPIHIPSSGKFPPGSSPVALAPPIKTHGISINDNGNGDIDREGDGGSSGPVKEIREVTITVPKVPSPPIIPPPLPQDIKLPPVGPGGGCEMYENCPPYKGGGGGSGPSGQSADQWAKDHIDASALKNNKCADEVYQKLKDNSAFFNNLLGKFEGNSILDLKFDIRDVGSTIAGATEVENIKNGNITIALNPNYLGSTELGRASVMIHEMLHAYMTWQLVNSGWDGINSPESYKSINKDNLPSLLKAYKEKLYLKPGESEHEFISNYYIPKIVNALKAYDTNSGTTDSEYNALAWGGLYGTSAFADLQKKDPDRAATIISILADNIKKESCKN
ncbi:TPA: hypothetical protein NEG48_001482 [Elizabethkingia anophelis]|nr:hypothetical protein [Elizabethkingia anophelis]